MTESVVALPHGSASEAGDRARVRRTRTRARIGVTGRSRKARRLVGSAAAGMRRAGRVMWLDAADSWIVRESTPSIRQVWRTDYPALAVVDYRPFRLWCRGWRYPAVVFAAVLDSGKWCLIHPVRGPLLLAAVGAGITAAIH